MGKKFFLAGVFVVVLFCPALADSQPGFYVKENKIYAPGGEELIMRGVNKMFVWNDKEGTNMAEIAKTGANTVRIVWAIKDGTAEELDRLIGLCAGFGMVPMIELHDKKCKWDDDVFTELTAYWTSPEVVEVIKKHDKYLFLNYGNEIGDWRVGHLDFIEKYSKAVNDLRTAGIRVPIVIDGVKCGQDIDFYYIAAEEILKADPEKNIIYSLHPWWQEKTVERIQDALEHAKYVKVPLIIGGFAPFGANCSKGYRYDTVIEECEKRGIGWLAWSWGPGNSDCAAMDMTKDGMFKSLFGWGEEVALTSRYSIKNTSKTIEYMKQFASRDR